MIAVNRQLAINDPIRGAVIQPGSEAGLAVPTFGFICGFPDEVGHILEAARTFNDACIIVVRRKTRIWELHDPILDFDDSLFTDGGVPIVVWPEEKMLELDGFFDVIVYQAPFSGMNEFKLSLIAAIPDRNGQYPGELTSGTAIARTMDVRDTVPDSRAIREFLINLARSE